MSDVNQTVNFEAWVAQNQHLLKPPVGNKQLFPAGADFITMVVGGPNQRTDYHIDPYEEFFYQVKGNIHVNVMTDDGPDRIDIREGEMWVLPRNLPHSPQRPEAGSVGLVIERVREEGTLERFRWYCGECNGMVHEVEVQVRDIVTDLPPLFNAFYESEEARTCPSCGTLHPGQGARRDGTADASG
ncbi:MAG: 3-hydroxyanthranilate 3,4-dioxygenase [Ilumatobacteraceae bacterium]